MIELWKIIIISLATLVGSTGALFLKKGSQNLSFNLKKLILNYKLFLGLSLYVVATIPFIFIMKTTPLSIIYPLVSSSYIWAILLAIIFLKEKMNKFKWIGIITIIIGIIILGFS